MTHPVPDAALDDRLGFTGTAGSGKTYNAGSAVERVLNRGGRVIIPDPLGVWWGLRLDKDGRTASPFDVVIFGGPHGDLPLNEHAGALIGETVAGMRESCILDLSELGIKAAERRFMLAFLTALYRKASGEPVHVVFDEADMWAPQKLLDRDGDAARLLGMMETIVRRGRVKGFIPWLITQRPAVLSKDVLSQVDGLAAFKLTSSQDRDALEGWIEGQAEKGQWKEIRAALPTMQMGQGVVWVPGRGIMATRQFPEKLTFDSSRTPKRGEKKRAAQVKPIDLSALKERLSTVEAEAKANDPRALKAEIAKLKSQLAVACAKLPDVGPAAIEEAARHGYAEGLLKGHAFGHAEGWEACKVALDRALDGVRELYQEALSRSRAAIAAEESLNSPPALPPTNARRAGHAPTRAVDTAVPRAQPSPGPKAGGDGSLSGPQRQMLRALAWWRAMGHEQPSRVQVATIAGWRVTSGHLKNVAGSLRTLGLIDYPSDGAIALTDAGIAAAPPADATADLEESVRAILTGPQRLAFDHLPRNGRPASREELAHACGWEPTSGHIKNVLGSMRSLEIIDYPSQGMVARAKWLTS